MTNELDVLSRHRPTTSGPGPDLTESATRTFSEFLESQTPPATIRESRPTRRLLVRRPLAIAALAVTVLAAGGVAIAVIGDGVVYVEPVTQIAETDGLILVVQDSNIGPCLEVRTEDGSMAGGCSTDFDAPLSVGFGLISGRTFVSGWAPHRTVEVVITFPTGETLSVTALQVVEGYDVVFFVASPVPSPENGPVSPYEAAAYDAEGNTLATVSYSG